MMIYQDAGIAGEGNRGLKSLEGCASDSLTASSKKKIKSVGIAIVPIAGFLV
jgi:hypothetical protein